MKRILLILLLFSWNLDAQTIFRVNNSPGVTGVNVYTTIQDAHDAASDGDIIYVEPSLNSYGSLISIKRLTILGNGYYLDSNATKNYTLRSSILDHIYLQGGSDNSSLEGLTFNTLTGNSVNGIVIQRCNASGIQLSGNVSENCSNWVVSQNRVSSIYGNATYRPTNCIFSNNIILSTIGNTGTNCLIEHNTFLSGTLLGGLNGTDIFSNIFLTLDCNACTQESLIINTTGARVENNIAITRNTSSGNISQYVLPNSSGNVNSAAYEDCFQISDPMISGYLSNDNHVILSNTSPAKGVGKNGLDAGAFGGVNPYVLAGQIPYPIITDFKSTGAGNASVPLQINITVKGNN